jgi:ATP-dependent RNA helicase
VDESNNNDKILEVDGEVVEVSEKLQIVDSFDKMNLKEDLLRGVYAYGFNKPSAVQ